MKYGKNRELYPEKWSRMDGIFYVHVSIFLLIYSKFADFTNMLCISGWRVSATL